MKNEINFGGISMLSVSVLCFLMCLNVGCVWANTLLGPKKFVVVTASYNNIDFVDKYLESVFSQKFDDNKFTFRVIY